MTKKITILIFAALLVIIISVWSVIFIIYSNDHLECDTVTETIVGKSGETISTAHHICKEKFNF